MLYYVSWSERKKECHISELANITFYLTAFKIFIFTCNKYTWKECDVKMLL